MSGPPRPSGTKSPFVRLTLPAGLLLLLLGWGGVGFFVSSSRGQTEPVTGLDGLSELPFQALSQSDQNALGTKALAIHPAAWTHSETEHFIYHFIHSYVATPISVEAEFSYRVISQDLGLEAPPTGIPKSHIYIFETPADWDLFKRDADLEPWTGGIHSRGSLFIMRDPSYKLSNNSLSHEVAHLVLARVNSRSLPIWLEEGYAEYTSRIVQASYRRARNYDARARSSSLPSNEVIPLARLTAATNYPDAAEIDAFYQECERLVRFLTTSDPTAFRALMDTMGRGETFESAFSSLYSARFLDIAALETAFLAYVSKDAAQPPSP